MFDSIVRKVEVRWAIETPELIFIHPRRLHAGLSEYSLQSMRRQTILGLDPEDVLTRRDYFIILHA